MPCAACGEQLDKAETQVPPEEGEQQLKLPIHAYRCPHCGARTRVANDGRPANRGGRSERGSDG